MSYRRRGKRKVIKSNRGPPSNVSTCGFDFKASQPPGLPTVSKVNTTSFASCSSGRNHYFPWSHKFQKDCVIPERSGHPVLLSFLFLPILLFPLRPLFLFLTNTCCDCLSKQKSGHQPIDLSAICQRS